MGDVDSESATEAAAKPSAILLITHLSQASIDTRVGKAPNGLSTAVWRNLWEVATSLRRAREQRNAFRLGGGNAISLGNGRLEPEKLVLS